MTNWYEYQWDAVSFPNTATQKHQMHPSFNPNLFFANNRLSKSSKTILFIKKASSRKAIQQLEKFLPKCRTWLSSKKTLYTTVDSGYRYFFTFSLLTFAAAFFELTLLFLVMRVLRPLGSASGSFSRLLSSKLAYNNIDVDTSIRLPLTSTVLLSTRG